MKKCNKDNKGRILIKNIVFILILLSNNLQLVSTTVLLST